METTFRSVALSVTVATSALLIFAAPAARADTFPTIAYRLAAGSTYQEGCFDPCMCPILLEQPMTGTFDLVFYPYAGPLWTVGIENVVWSVPSLGKDLAGQGSYRRVGDQQTLRLDLQINGAAPAAFDSGWVTGGSDYPVIDVTLSMHGLFCYDIGLRVRAVPVVETPELAVDAAQLTWSAVPGVSAYDALCGDLLELRASHGDFGSAVDVCLSDDSVDTNVPYDITVQPGEAVWFLVRSQGGSWDAGGASQVESRDETIASSSLACP